MSLAAASFQSRKQMSVQFQNSSQLGAFGEYAYLYHIQNAEIKVQPARILEYDFLLQDSNGNQFKVDVKSSLRLQNRYTRKRIRQDIIYDLVMVDGNRVLLAPDPSSPLFVNGSPQEIGDLDKLYDQWQKHRAAKNSIPHRVRTLHHQNRNKIKREIFEIFIPSRVRVVVRGSVSEDRWSSLPDNLPGTASVIGKYDATVFLQMRTKDDHEEISRIIVIVHRDLALYPMKPSDSRQKTKGIESVFDISTFQSNFQELVFQNLDDLRKRLPLIARERG